MDDFNYKDNYYEKFSKDLSKFNQDCIKLIEFIKQCVENTNELYVLYMSRNGNLIDYGRCDLEGTRITSDTIKMVSNEDLRKLYRLLQQEFASNFIDGCNHTFSEGWSLNPTIGENVVIDINSDNSYDKNWFYEEVRQRRTKSDSPKKI